MILQEVNDEGCLIWHLVGTEAHLSGLQIHPNRNSLKKQNKNKIKQLSMFGCGYMLNLFHKSRILCKEMYTKSDTIKITILSCSVCAQTNFII